MSSIYMVGNGRIELFEGNIRDYRADALICPANQKLLVEVRGASRAIVDTAGRATKSEVQRLSGLYRHIRQGNVIVTTAGRMAAKYIIHAVCNHRDEGGDYHSNRTIIGDATRNSLNAANGLMLFSVGFPALGTGMGGVPLEDGVDVMMDEFADHFRSQTSLERIGLVLFGESAYEKALGVAERKSFTPVSTFYGTMCRNPDLK